MDTEKTVSLRELEHSYFMDLVYNYMERNDVLYFDFHYDKRCPNESGEILVYTPNSDCRNGKERFIPVK